MGTPGVTIMIKYIGKFLKDILTGQDNETFDQGRFLCIFSFFFYFGASIGSILIHKPWGALDFAGGISAMAVGFGIHLRLKNDSEPGKQNDPHK